MPRKHKGINAMGQGVRMHCDRCKVEAVGLRGHIKIHHKDCIERVKGNGSPRKGCGVWVIGPA